MYSRLQVATILGVSERSVRRYRDDFAGFFNDGADFTDTELELLKLIVRGKANGKDTNDVIRAHMAEYIRQAGQQPGHDPAGKPAATGVQSASAEGQESRQAVVVPVTREELLGALVPVVDALKSAAQVNRQLLQTVADLQLEVASLKRRTAPAVPAIAAAPATTRPTAEMSWLRRLWLSIVNPIALRENDEPALA